MTEAPVRIDELVARVDRLVRSRSGARVVVGIVGTPGSGKTTLAEAVVAALLDADLSWAMPAPREDARRPWIGSHVAHVPMDGFHLADVELRRLGRLGRKGAPDTFDASGYAALLRRLRGTVADVWAPAFDRDIEQPIAGSVPVLRAAQVVVTEGNYLLLDDSDDDGGGWREVRDLLDETWYCEPADDVRRRRLVARHEQFGKNPEHARTWVAEVDERNAEIIRATRVHADLVLTGDVPLTAATAPDADAPG